MRIKPYFCLWWFNFSESKSKIFYLAAGGAIFSLNSSSLSLSFVSPLWKYLTWSSQSKNRTSVRLLKALTFRSCASALFFSLTSTSFYKMDRNGRKKKCLLCCRCLLTIFGKNLCKQVASLAELAERALSVYFVEGKESRNDNICSFATLRLDFMRTTFYQLLLDAYSTIWACIFGFLQAICFVCYILLPPASKK